MILTTSGGCGPSDRFFEQFILQDERRDDEEELSQEVYAEKAGDEQP